jgi:hypothetical protein
LALYLLHSVLLLLLAYALYRRYSDSPLRKFFLPALALKLAGGVAVGLIYTWYYNYGGDTFLFHKEGSVLAGWAKRDITGYVQFLFTSRLPDAGVAGQLTFLTQPRALVMAKVVSLLHLATGSNYWLAGAWLSLFSFWGGWRLADRLALLLPQDANRAAVSFLFFPSVVFWTSGVLKETLSAGIIGLVCSCFLSYLYKLRPAPQRRMILEGLLVAAGLAVLWQLKFYYCAVLVLCLAVFLVSRAAAGRFQVKSLPGQLVLFEVVLTGLAGLAFLLPGLSVQGLLAAMVQNHDAHLSAGVADPALVFESLRPALSSILLHAPKALVAGLFRPFPWEADNLFGVWVGIENFSLLLATGWAFLRLLRRKERIRTHFLLLLGTLHYVGLLAVVLSLAAPNFGEMSRYKVVYLPFFVFVILLALPPSGRGKPIRV